MYRTKQKHTYRYREQIMVTSGEREEDRGKIGIGKCQPQTTIYKMNKLQGYNEQHREYS